jgi:serine/threonine protein kinase
MQRSARLPTVRGRLLPATSRALLQARRCPTVSPCTLPRRKEPHGPGEGLCHRQSQAPVSSRLMLSNGTLIDRYTVDSVIGTGGTAVVYRVTHSKLGTYHALKVLSVTSRSIRERMLREGRVQATLDHPNIVTVTDVLEVEGQPGLLMEYIPGPSLERALEEYHLDAETAEALFLGIVAGVQTAHEHGLVHRDLKPANVLLAYGDGGYTPKVTDFGLAKVLVEDQASGAGQTRQGVAMGTPAYMAPEQIRDAKSVDVRADIWSLGCILYELFASIRAFPGDDTLAIYNAVVSGDIVPPQEYNANLEDRVEMAIRGCLAIQREERIPDCDTLLAVLRGDETWAAPELQGTLKEPTVEMTDALDAPTLPLAARKSMSATPPAAVPRRREPRPGGSSPAAAAQTILTPGGDPLFGPLPGQSHTGEPGPVVAGGMGTLTDDPGDEPEPRRRRGALFYLAWGTAILFVLFWVGVGGVVVSMIGPAARQSTEYEDLARTAEPPPEPEAASEPEELPPEPAPVDAPAPIEAPAPTAAPAPAPTPTPVAAPVPASPVPVVATAPSPVPATPKTLTVKLLSVPATAFVTIDGEASRRTPLKESLTPGPHRVRLEVNGEQRDFSINVRPGAENKWCYLFATEKLLNGSCP